MSTNSDMQDFKEKYPTVYQKFLEMNRALGALQRAASTADPGKDRSDYIDLSNAFLEPE